MSGWVRLGVFAVTACAAAEPPSSTDLQAEALASLTAHEGCGDVVLLATHPADTLALYFVLPGPTRAAYDAGLTTSTHLIDLTAPGGWALELREGADLGLLTCNDPRADTDTRGEITHTWLATGGEASLSLETTGERSEAALPAIATLTLTDARFSDGVRTLELASFTLTADVGDFPAEPEP